MNVTDIQQDKKEFNTDGTYNGAYGDMVQVPKSLYNFMLSSSQQILPAVNKHVIAQNVDKAKRNASDPKAYRYYMNQAALYKKYNVNNPDMDQRIRQSLTDPDLQRIEGHIKRLRTSPVLKTDEGMKHYQNLQIERERRYKVLEDSEHEKYRQFINNPSNNITPGPESMSDTPYHSRVVKSFLAAHPDMIQNDVTGNLYVMGKKISDDPKQVGRIIHFITHDYSDLSKTPQGTSAVLNAFRKKGFNIKDIGNTYLREHLQKKLEHKRRVRQQQQSGVSATPPQTPASAAISRPVTPLSSIARRSTGGPSKIDDLTNQVSHMIRKYAPSTTTKGSPPSPRPSASLLTPPPTPASSQQQRRPPHAKESSYQETPSRKRARTDDTTTRRYSLRTRPTKKRDDDLPRKKAKRKHKKQ